MPGCTATVCVWCAAAEQLPEGGGFVEPTPEALYEARSGALTQGTHLADFEQSSHALLTTPGSPTVSAGVAAVARQVLLPDDGVLHAWVIAEVLLQDAWVPYPDAPLASMASDAQRVATLVHAHGATAIPDRARLCVVPGMGAALEKALPPQHLALAAPGLLECPPDAWLHGCSAVAQELAAWGSALDGEQHVADGAGGVMQQVWSASWETSAQAHPELPGMVDITLPPCAEPGMQILELLHEVDGELEVLARVPMPVLPPADWPAWQQVCFPGQVAGAPYAEGAPRERWGAGVDEAAMFMLAPRLANMHDEHASEAGMATGGDLASLDVPITHVDVLLPEMAVPGNARPQAAGMDGVGMVQLATEGHLVAPDSMQQFGLSDGVVLAMLMDDGSSDRRAITGLSFATAETADVRAAAEVGDAVDVAPLVKASGIARAAGVRMSAAEPAPESKEGGPGPLWLVTSRQAGADPVLDAALVVTIGEQEPDIPGGYEVASAGLAWPGAEPLRVWLACTRNGAAAADAVHHGLAAADAAAAAAEEAMALRADAASQPGTPPLEPAQLDSMQLPSLLSAADEAAQRAALEEQLAALEEEQEALHERHKFLEQTLATYFSLRTSEDDRPLSSNGASRASSAAATSRAETADIDGEGLPPKLSQYRDTLKAVLDKQLELQSQQEGAAQRAVDMQLAVESRREQLEDVTSRMQEWWRAAVRTAVDSNSGRHLSKDRSLKFEMDEERTAAELQQVRLRNLLLQIKHDKLQEALAEKEQLAEGLALIDFEQLKIENSTLAEKIEDRNEELAKLRRKTTTTVQVLTHVKEKLQFVACTSDELAKELGSVEREVANLRAQLAEGKAVREAQRAEIDAKRTARGFAHMDALAKDFERRKRSGRSASQEHTQLRAEHAKLLAQLSQLNAQCIALTGRDTGVALGNTVRPHA